MVEEREASYAAVHMMEQLNNNSKWWTVLGQYLLVLPQKDYRGTKYLIAHESKQRITVKKTKLIL